MASILDEKQQIEKTTQLPYRLKTPKKKKPVELDEFQNAFITAIKELEEPKKPVKYIKPLLGKDDSMLKFGLFLDPALRITINDALSKKEGKPVDVIQRLTENEDEKDYISILDEVRTGLETGSHKLGSSIGQLLFSGTDLATNQDFTTEFNKLMARSKPEEPQTWRGELVSLMTQFVAPGAVIAKVVGRIGKVGKIKKLQLAMGTSKASTIAQRVVQGASIVGATDFVASQEGRDTLYFEPESLKGLTGSKRAAASLRNKLRHGAEGTIIGGGFPLVGKAVQQVYKYIAAPTIKGVGQIGTRAIDYTVFKPASAILSSDTLSPVVRPLAKFVRQAPPFVLKKALAPIIKGKEFGTGPLKKRTKEYFQLPPYKEWRLGDIQSPNQVKRRLKKLDNFLGLFRAYGNKPVDIANISEKTDLYIKSRARRIDRTLEGLDKKAYDLAKKFEKRYNGNKTSPAGERDILNQVDEYLKNQRKLTDVEPELQILAKDLKDIIIETTKEFKKVLPKGKDADEITKELAELQADKVHKYLVRSFSTFTNPYWNPPKNIRIEARDWVATNVVKKNRDLREIAENEFKSQRINDPDAVYREYADTLVDGILHLGRSENTNPLMVLKDISKNILRNKDYKFLKTGEELPTAIKNLLGPERNLKSSVLFTTTATTVATATKRAADYIANSGIKNKWLFNTIEEARLVFPDAVKIGKIPRLGPLKNPLENLYTSPEYAAGFKGTGSNLDSFIKLPIVKQMLQAKFGIQVGKTLYSPTTQVRNVLSASFFALNRGHIGHRASVTDSLRMVVRDIFKAGKGIDEVVFNKHIEKLTRLGILDENVVASELRAVMASLKSGAINTQDDLFQKLIKMTPTDKVARVYAGGDNLWKDFGYNFEKSNLSMALKSLKEVEEWFKYMGAPFNKIDEVTGVVKTLDDALDEAAAYAIRNIYPTYSKVPPFVQAIRKVPIMGNFVAFPQQMMATYAKGINHALKESAHPNKAIRQMGMRALIGTGMTTYGFGKAISETAYYLTNSSDAQWDAWKRSAAAPWDKNGNHIAVTGWKDGEAAAFNFSYFSPYDVLSRPLEAALAQARQQNLNPQETEAFVLDLFFNEQGPLIELLAPFISEPIGFDRFLDVTKRGGKTAEGFSIYSASDSMDEKFNKSFAHIMQGVKPGVMSTADKIAMGIEGDLAGSGKPINLRDELLALFTGVRINRIDVKKDLRYFASDMNRLLRAVDETEKFYSVKNWMDKTPSDTVAQFEQMQDEAFRIQKNMYMKVKDLMLLDLSRSKIENILEESGVNSDLAFNLVRGKFTPVNYSEKRFETKVKFIKDSYKGTNKLLNKSWAFPERQLDVVIRKRDNKKFFNETYNQNDKQFEGGYYPEREQYEVNAKGNLKLDDNGNPMKKRKINLWQKGIGKAVDFGKRIINPLSNVMGKAPTPPLPDTPPANVQMASAATAKSPITNLTRTEEALLSPTDKVIAART